MATEEVPQENLEEKLGDLNLDESENVGGGSEEQKEAVLEELVDSPPELHHVETADITEPPSTEDGVVKSEVPEAFSEELKSDHDIVPAADKETPTENVETPAADEEIPTENVETPAAGEVNPTENVETVAQETGAEDGETAPATREVPVEVTHEDVDEKKPSKLSALGGKISEKLHKIVSKD